MRHSGQRPKLGDGVQEARRSGREHNGTGFGGIFSSVIMARVNPHRLSLACALESTFTVEIESTAIGNKHVLVESLVTRQ